MWLRAAASFARMDANLVEVNTTQYKHDSTSLTSLLLLLVSLNVEVLNRLFAPRECITKQSARSVTFKIDQMYVKTYP
jgi:hypothetical protein